MSAKTNGAIRTGRTALVQKYLAGQHAPKTARQILEAVEPKGNISKMTATLGTMLRNKCVEKIGAGIGNVKWQRVGLATSSAKSAARAVNKKSAPTPKSEGHAPPAARPKSAKPTSTTIVQAPRSATSREQKTNFSAPLSTVKSVAKRNPAAGAQTVAEFLRLGGRIQYLKNGECSQPLQYDHSHYAEHRARGGRATQQSTRATKRP